VLEVGVGTGKNMPYYPAGIRVTAVDLSGQMLSRARRRAPHLRLPVPLVQTDVQALAFPDAAFDTAVATFVFCSVPDPVRGLREVARVVRLGGLVVLLEHVRAEGPILGRLMDLLDPLIVRLMVRTSTGAPWTMFAGPGCASSRLKTWVCAGSSSSSWPGTLKDAGTLSSLKEIPSRLLADVFVFTNGVKGEGPFGFQPDVFDAAPGDPRYTPLRRVNLVTWKDGVRARVLRSVEEVQRGRARSEVTVAHPGVVVNMPFLTWSGGQR